jgi:hypothetical protein
MRRWGWLKIGEQKVRKVGNIKKGKNYPCNRPWRPIGLRDVEAPTFSRQSAHRWR